MSKTCAQLCSAMGGMLIGSPEENVTGLAYRSDKVLPGDAFFCIVGLKADGHSFAQDAINRGAKVLVAERKVYLADASDVTIIMVKDARKALAQAAAAFFDNPSHEFSLVGITGTNGKTTTTYLVNHIVQSVSRRCGVIGTVGVSFGNHFEKSEHTTPESSDLQALFARMNEAACDVVAMEVSSHALDLMRTWGTHFEVTAFTNLTQDHLDYHHTFEAYFEAKAQLFSKNYPAKRVICIDDKWGRELLKRCTQAEEAVITTGFSEDALIHPVEVDYKHASTLVTLNIRGSHYQFEYPLVGRFNVSNVMTAIGIALCLGISVEATIRALQDVDGVPGRLQRIKTANDGGVSVFVDYAHTPDALEKVILSVLELKPNRLLVVFGCGGDRDATKRSIMGRVALSADFAIVTSDNPRSEDPLAIIDDIVAGMGEQTDQFEVVADRREAIKRAIALSAAGDAIIIAGKGHEDYQIIGDQKQWFDDTVVAAEELEARFS